MNRQVLALTGPICNWGLIKRLHESRGCLQAWRNSLQVRIKIIDLRYGKDQRVLLKWRSSQIPPFGCTRWAFTHHSTNTIIWYTIWCDGLHLTNVCRFSRFTILISSAKVWGVVFIMYAFHTILFQRAKVQMSFVLPLIINPLNATFNLSVHCISQTCKKYRLYAIFKHF